MPSQVRGPEFRLTRLTNVDCFSGGVLIGMQASPAYQQKLLSLEARLWETTGILWYSTPISSIWWGFFIVFFSPSLLTLFCGLELLDLGFLWGQSFHMVLFFFSGCPSLYLKKYQESPNKPLPSIQWRRKPSRCFSAWAFWGMSTESKENIWFQWFGFSFVPEFGIEPKALCIASKPSSTELCSQSFCCCLPPPHEVWTCLLWATEQFWYVTLTKSGPWSPVNL